MARPVLLLAATAAFAGYTRAAAAAAPDQQLYAFAIRGVNRTGETASTAVIDAVTGKVDFTRTSVNGGSDAFCDIAFRKKPEPAYIVPAAREGGKPGEQQVLTIHASSGLVTHAANVTKPYEWPASAFDDDRGLVWAVGIPPDGGADIITINPESGHVEVVAPQIGIPDIQLCEAAFLNGQFFFAWMDDVSQIICTYDVATKNLTQRHYVMCPGECRGGMNTMVPFTTAANETHLLAMAVYGGPGAPRPSVIEIDPTEDDKITTLATCPEDTISSPQGAGAFDPVSRNFYNVMLYTNNTPCCTVYYQLVTTNLDAPAYDLLRLDEGGKPGPEPQSQIWSIDIGPVA